MSKTIRNHVTEVDIFQSWLPTIAGIIITVVGGLILFGFKKFSQTTEGQLTGTIKLEHVTTGLDNLEERVNKSFEKVEKIVKEVEDRTDVRFGKVYDVLQEFKVTQYNLIWRVENVEKKLNGKGGSPHIS